MDNDRRDANQAKLDRLVAQAQSRIPVGATITNKRGTARWNGLAWVYGR
jgi:hypothetical protein